MPLCATLYLLVVRMYLSFTRATARRYIIVYFLLGLETEKQGDGEKAG